MREQSQCRIRPTYLRTSKSPKPANCLARSNHFSTCQRAKAAQAKAHKERESLEAKAAQERTAAAALALAEKKKREAVEAELKAKRDAEEAKVKAELDAARRAAAAPDKEKLHAFAMKVRGLEVPDMATEAGQNAKKLLLSQIIKFADFVNTMAEKL